jgi:two-component system aerobic respiration control sensor histidine kinase ArcB
MGTIKKKFMPKSEILSKDIISSVINNVPHFIFWKDRNLVFRGCNKKFAEQFGFSTPEEIIGKTDYDFPWSEELRDKYIQDDIRIIETEIPQLNYEETQIQMDGTIDVVLVSKVPFYNHQGDLIGILGVYTDITERKIEENNLKIAKEHAEAADIAKTNFLATISHELRTPLNGILGNLHILKQQKTPEIVQNHLQDIEKSAQYLLSLVGDILDFSSASLEKISIREIPFNIHAVAQSVLKDVSDKALTRKIQLSYQRDESLPELLMGDPIRLRQILINLADNAIKFTPPKGKINLIIQSKNISGRIATVQFRVQDTGIGIAQDMQEKIFERFSQVSSDYKRAYEGVGLGLAICKQIVDAMQGEIRVVSEIGKGSEFWVELSFNLQLSRKKFDEHLTENLEEICSQFPCKILLIEDNAINQKVASFMLKEFGCEIDIAEDGYKAIQLITENSYDLVFLDIGLPKKDGIQVAKEIRAFEKYKNIPIIAVTAYAFDADIERCYEAGVNDVLTKPFTINALKNILSHWVQSHKP